MSRSSTPARIMTPIRVRLSASHMPTPMSDGGGENDETHHRILQKHRLAARSGRATTIGVGTGPNR